MASTKQNVFVNLTCRPAHFTAFRFPLTFSLLTSDEAIATRFWEIVARLFLLSSSLFSPAPLR
jgi:hypothetical protein